jgi:tetratricopeptide (TPR) repeat protein
LFERFKWRFILAPIFLVLVCVAFTWWDLKGIVLVVFLWGVWHGMMQTYGFCRIYDAKVGSFAAFTRRLDFAVCAVWFAAAVMLSPQRMAVALETNYASGGPHIASSLLQGAQKVFLGAAIAVSVMFLANYILMWVRGQRPNPVKVVLLGTSIAFWWYCNNWVTNILVGIALFEVFHDVQYLSIVWIYNRNRVEKDRTITGFMRFVFRRSGSLLGLYVGLVIAYGSLSLLKEVQIDVVKQALTGLVAASALLHFYYDGFIWKVREKSTRESLGLAGGTGNVNAALGLFPGWAIHGLKWVLVFAIPLGALWVGQVRSTVPESERLAWLAEACPQNANTHYKYGLALQAANRLPEATEQFRKALAIAPALQPARYSYGQTLMQQGRFVEASDELQKVLAEDPRNADFRCDYGYVLSHLGLNDKATEEFATAIQLSPQSARVHYNFAMFLAQTNQPDQAMAEFEKCLQLNPESAEAHYYLGEMYFFKRDMPNARLHYVEAARLNPTSPVHNHLGIVYMELGEVSQAIAAFNEALRQHPDDADAAENLKYVLAGGGSSGSTSR